MYERMLDKQQIPSEAEFLAHCGAAGSLFEALDTFLTHEAHAERQLRFPYGNHYGWSMKYSVKKLLLCDVFAERDAFTVMLRLTNSQFARVYGAMSSYTQCCIDSKYPCGEGGWIHYRVLTSAHLADIESLLRQKLGGK